MTIDTLIDRVAIELDAPAANPLDERLPEIDDMPTEVELMVLLSGMVGDPGASLAF